MRHFRSLYLTMLLTDAIFSLWASSSVAEQRFYMAQTSVQFPGGPTELRAGSNRDTPLSLVGKASSDVDAGESMDKPMVKRWCGKSTGALPVPRPSADLALVDGSSTAAGTAQRRVRFPRWADMSDHESGAMGSPEGGSQGGLK